MEKYRPLLLDDITGNQETIDRLKVIARDGNCPHIIISVRLRCFWLSGPSLTEPVGHSGYRQDNEHPLSCACAARRSLQGGRAGAQRV